MYYHILYLRIYGLPCVIYDVFGLPCGLPLPMISTGFGKISYAFPYALHGITYGIAYDFRGSVYLLSSLNILHSNKYIAEQPLNPIFWFSNEIK